MTGTGSSDSQLGSLVEAALRILTEPDPWEKARLTREAVCQWRAGELDVLPAERAAKLGSALLKPPDKPARSEDKVKRVAPGQAPRLGKGGTLSSRQAILHSLCNIENWAIDLAWDAIARWSPHYAPFMPRDFYDDFLLIADDECRHFLALEQRLKELGSFYGALPVHDGLWESASETSHSLAARLAVEHCVHEARGLDVLPFTVDKFRRHGDEESAALLEGVIYPEEITHCAAGVRWLGYLHRLAHSEPALQDAAVDVSSNVEKSSTAPAQCDSTQSSSADDSEAQTPGHGEQQEEQQGGGDHCRNDMFKEARQFQTVEGWFHHLVRSHFRGSLKPPFNVPARTQAGFEPSWYEPLSSEADDKLHCRS